MLRTILLFIALCITANSWANATIDSLSNSLTHKNDSNDCKTYQRLCFAYLDIDLDKAKDCAQKALAIAKSINRESSIISSKNAIGLTHFYKSEYEKAKKYWQSALLSVNNSNKNY